MEIKNHEEEARNASQPRRKISPKRMWPLLIAFNCALFLVVALLFEVALRVFPPAWLSYRMSILAESPGANVGTDQDWKVFRNEKGELVSYEKNERFDVVHDEYQHEANTDEFGGRAIANAKMDAQEIVPFLGDSFTFGLGVTDAECYASLLQANLNRRVINFGIPGSCLKNQIRTLEYHFDILGKPKVAVFFVYTGNDLYEIVQAMKSDTVDGPQPPPGSAAPMTVLQRLNLLTLITPFRQSYAVQYSKKVLMGLLNRSQSRGTLDGKVEAMLEKNREVYSARCFTQVERLKKLQDELGFRSVIVLVPHKYQTDTEQRNLIAKYYGMDLDSFKVHLPNEIFGKALSAHGIPVIDATDALTSNEAESLYYRYDDHFTPIGHEAFAKAVGKGLADKISELWKITADEALKPAGN